MKNQYFGDSRDLFKYDLVISLMLDYNLSKNFIFVPMLTRDTGNSHGSITNYKIGKPGTKRPDLVAFLSDCLKRKKRDVNEIIGFFETNLAAEGLSINLYKRGDYFRDSFREDYFNALPLESAKRTIVMLDPDTGLETETYVRDKDAYLRYDEVKSIYDRLDNNSVLLLFQFIPRVKRLPYIRSLCNRLTHETGTKLPVNYVSDNSVVFFALSKNIRNEKVLRKSLVDYGKRYDLIYGASRR